MIETKECSRCHIFTSKWFTTFTDSRPKCESCAVLVYNSTAQCISPSPINTIKEFV